MPSKDAVANPTPEGRWSAHAAAVTATHAARCAAATTKASYRRSVVEQEHAEQRDHLRRRAQRDQPERCEGQSSHAGLEANFGGLIDWSRIKTIV